MKLYKELAGGLLAAHPLDAARALESLPEDETLVVLAEAPAAHAAETLRCMAPDRAAWVLANLDRDRAVALVEHLGSDLAANILRRTEESARTALIGALEPGAGRALRSLLRFPEGTAGALMDPNVLALPGDLSAEDALAHMRRSPENVRYNLYVVDRDQRLVGVLNLRELLLARRKQSLESIAHTDVLWLPAEADRHEIRTHPAWHDARSVPVVDEHGTYLGAVRYQTLRTLEEELRESEPDSAGQTVEALGDLYATGIACVFGALATSVSRPFPAERDA